MKKIIINMIIALLISSGAYLIFRIVHMDEFLIGWFSCMVYIGVFFIRKGSGLRLIPEKDLQEIDKNK